MKLADLATDAVVSVAGHKWLDAEDYYNGDNVNDLEEKIETAYERAINVHNASNAEVYNIVSNALAAIVVQQSLDNETWDEFTTVREGVMDSIEPDLRLSQAAD